MPEPIPVSLSSLGLMCPDGLDCPQGAHHEVSEQTLSQAHAEVERLGFSHVTCGKCGRSVYLVSNRELN